MEEVGRTEVTQEKGKVSSAVSSPPERVRRIFFHGITASDIKTNAILPGEKAPPNPFTKSAKSV